MSRQFDLFGRVVESAPARHALPAGFRYVAGLITPSEHDALVERVRELPFREFEFHGYTGKRRVISFGWKYDFAASRLDRAADIPSFLTDLRVPAAAFAGLPADELQQVLVTEYAAGAGIGWHRDKTVFGDVVGISLLAPCTFRLRRRAGEKWERVNLVAEPRSAYHLSGVARTEWEHSIPAVDALRYSITFRSLRESALSQQSGSPPGAVG